MLGQSVHLQEKFRETKARALWIDVARVAATLLIVLYHMSSSLFSPAACPAFLRVLGDCFASAGGPLVFFFFVSGYFTPKDLCWQKRLRRMTMLMLSYIVWNILYAAGLNDEVTVSRIFGFLGHPCADYPLWYLFALVELLLLHALARRFLLLVGCCMLALILYGQGWIVPLDKYLVVPSPLFVLAFIAGSGCAHISPDKLKMIFLYGLPVIVVIVLLRISEEVQAFAAACLLLSLGSVFQCCWKKGACVVAELASVSFLCYAIHAGVILGGSMIFARFCPAFLESGIVYSLMPLCIYAASVVMYNCMRKWLPGLLSVLAYSGRLGWLEKVLSSKV